MHIDFDGKAVIVTGAGKSIGKRAALRFADLGAYAVAYVDLDEGFRIFTNIMGVENPTTDIECGMRVRVSFEEQDEGEFPIPVFVPA